MKILQHNSASVPKRRLRLRNDIDAMYNNTLVSHSETMPKACTPVVIMNSKVKDIDGLKMDFASDVNAAVTIAGCEVNEADVKNVEVVGENTARPYIIR